MFRATLARFSLTLTPGIVYETSEDTSRDQGVSDDYLANGVRHANRLCAPKTAVSQER